MTDLPMPVNRARVFSASNAARFMSCHASANLELAIPGWTPPVIDPMKGAKGRGTNMHKVLELAAEFTPTEMEAIATALNYVAALRRKRKFHVEAELSLIAGWLPSQPRTTLDLLLYTRDEMHIVDYKMGRIPVPVLDNEQLLYYAACAWPIAPRAKGVWVHIVQPLADNIDAWFITSDELEAFKKVAIETDIAITAGDVSFGPSDHCTFCPANPQSRGEKNGPFCPALMQMLYPKTFDEQAVLDL